MVPTLTMLGRFSECTRWLIDGPARLDEAVTLGIMTKGTGAGRAGSHRDRQGWPACSAGGSILGGSSAQGDRKPSRHRIWPTRIPSAPIPLIHASACAGISRRDPGVCGR
jgi:hypothetical protein